jgi:hypothetical protein
LRYACSTCFYSEFNFNIENIFIFFKVLDVERMLAKSSMDLTAKGMEQGHPVIRTLYDHMEVSPVHLNIEMDFIRSCKLWGNIIIPKISFRNDEQKVIYCIGVNSNCKQKNQLHLSIRK